MSIQIIEIRQFQGPATVELSGVGVPEIVEVRQGPAGVNGPNSVTSATTSDGTAQLTVDYLEASDYVAATNQLACYGSFVVASAALSTTIRNDGITDDRTLSLPDRSGSVALTEDYTGGTATIDVLNATVQGTLTAAHIHGNVAGSVYAHVRAGENLAKGDPVYISGSHGTGANLIAIVSKADASNAAKMPAVGVMDAAVSNNANGHMVITGTISDIDTNAYAVNSVLYVASGGGWTSTPPVANSQPVAIVERSNTNNGAVIVKVNGLASYGGNGASDANKLVRFTPNGGLSAYDIGIIGLISLSDEAATNNATIEPPLTAGDWRYNLPSADGVIALTSDLPTLGTNVATFLETPTSANLAAAVTDETGSGSLVFANLPTLTSPTLLNIPEATLAAIATLTGQTGAPPVVLFDDFFGTGNSTVGIWSWTDGTTGTAGTGSVDAGNTANGSSQYAGMCRISTAAVSGNGRIRFLNIGSSGKMIGTQWRACFAIPDITNVRITIGGQGGGGAYELRYDSSANSGQWVLAIAVNSVYTIYTFTAATALAGDFQSGKRYRMSLTRTSATLCTLVLEIADYNLANWSDVFRGTITHLAHFENLQAWQPMFTVTALEAVVKRLCVDWISVYNPNILR